MRTYEINEMTSCVKDRTVNELNSQSPIVKAYTAMTNGQSIDSIKDAMGKNVGQKCANHIKELNARAEAGDRSAIAELNTIRTYAIEPIVLEEIKLMGFFGDFEQVGYNEDIKRKVTKQNISTRGQALNGDVPFSFNYEDEYGVPTTSLSAGYEVDYRKAQFGDMSAENTLRQNIQTDIINKAKGYAFDKVINAVSNATIKNYAAGITHQNVQNVIDKARPFGRISLVGDTSAVIKLNPIATYADINTPPYVNISQEAMEEIRKNAYISNIMGATVLGIDNAYDLSKVNSNNWFDKIANDRYIYVVPSGIESPIKLWTRGGLTSFTGNDVSTGKLLTRYDLEVAADIAKGEEYKIGLIDTVSG